MLPRRAAMLALGLGLLCACKREPSFDERYAAASHEIARTSREIDAELASRASAAAAESAAARDGTLLDGPAQEPRARP